MTEASSQIGTALHVGKFYPPHRGGMETYLRDLLTALQAHGWCSLALVHESRDKSGPLPREPAPAEPRVVRVAVWANILFTPISPGFPWYLNRLLRESSPAVLHLHLPNVSAFWALMSPRARRIPWVVHWHADIPLNGLHRGLRWFYHLYRPFERMLLRRAAIIIATSPPYLDSSPALAPFRDRCRIVPLGTRRPSAPGRQPAPATATTGRPAPLRVIAVGRLAYYKGLESLVRAVARCPDVTLDIVGDGEGQGTLKTLIDNLNLGCRVRMLGNLSDSALDRQLRGSDCLCLPSIERTEAFGVVLLEAMARGKACVVTAVPGTGMAWVVQHGRTGLVVPPGDELALASALGQLAAEPALCEAMGRAGLERFHEEFDIEASAAAIAGIYNELAER